MNGPAPRNNNNNKQNDWTHKEGLLKSVWPKNGKLDEEGYKLNFLEFRDKNPEERILDKGMEKEVKMFL